MNSDADLGENTAQKVTRYLAGQTKNRSAFDLVPFYAVDDYQNYVCQNGNPSCVTTKINQGLHVETIKKAIQNCTTGSEFYQKNQQVSPKRDYQTPSAPVSNKMASSIDIGPRGMEGISFGDVYVSPNVIGKTFKHTDGIETTIAVGASDIYNGGVVSQITKTKTIVLTGQNGNESQSVNIGKSQVIEEKIGTCFASRIVQEQQIGTNNLNQMTNTQSIITEKHFDTEKCLGNPARILVGSAAATMLGPAVLVPLVPLIEASAY